jgi:DNA-binding transcriptional MocR family regulator
VVPVIDETLVDLAFDEESTPARMPPLARHAGNAFTVGSLSKAWWGGLRIGWVRAPSIPAAATLARLRLRSDLGTPVLEQLVAARLRQYDDRVAQRRHRLRCQRDALMESLASHLPGWRFRTPAGGQAIWCHLDGLSSTALSQAARACGLLLLPGTAFAPLGGLDGFLRLPFTAPETVLTQVGPRLVRAAGQAEGAVDCSVPTEPVVA